jgi:hypothetical protein
MEGLVPSETKEETTNSRLRTMDIGALAILGSLACTRLEEEKVAYLDRLPPYEGAARDERP